MVLFNYSTKELTAKIVYYGPGLCGKTTNLEFVYQSLPEEKKGRMLSLSTQTDRTLYFDFLPVDLGDIRGMKTRVQLYTVPGQVFYNETRRMVLKGVDGVVFVADSQKRMADANTESFRNLEANLEAHGLSLAELPLVLQFNKRDLPDVQSVEEMNAALNSYNAPFYEAVATTGIGVHDTLKAISKLVLRTLSKRHDLDGASDPQELALELPRELSPDLPRAEDWQSGDIESELEEMNAQEIQGLLEEIDGVTGEGSDDDALVSSGGEEGRQEDLFMAAHENAMGTDAEDAQLFGDDPEPQPARPAEDAGADSVWLGLPPGEDEGEDEGMAALSKPYESVQEAAAREERELSAFLPDLDDGEPAPEPEGSRRSLHTGEDAVAAASATSAQVDTAEDLSFESFRQGEQSGWSRSALPWDMDAAPPEAISASGGDGEPVCQVPAMADEGAEANEAPKQPSLTAGSPVPAGHGDLKVPLTFHLDGRRFTYVLTLSLQPEPDDLA